MVYNGIPVFAVNVDDPGCSISTMSLVDDPAMSIDMVCFSKEQKMNFSIQDESQHNILTCLVRVDFPILRITEDGNPYYIVFNKETAKVLCQRLMTDGMQQNISLQHNGKLIDGIQLQEVFIKDSNLGISPVGFEDAADGSLMGVYHIEDAALWNDCIEGRFKGISIESLLGIEEFKKIDNKKTKNSMSKIKDALKRLLMEFNSLSTNIADLYWEEDSELMVGYKVFVEDEAGNKVPAADGEYISDDNVIKVEGGVVTEIEKKEDAPEETQEEVKEDAQEAQEEAMEAVQEEVQETVEDTQETPAETPENEDEDKTAELEKRVADLESKIAELEAKLVEIATAPAAEPVVDEFEKVTKKSTTGDKKLDKRIAIAQALKQN
jgi:hypothetical protein